MDNWTRPGRTWFSLIWPELSPNNPRYSYTLAFYQLQKGDRKEAVRNLRDTVDRHPAYLDAVLLLGEIYERDGKKEEAREVYRKALSSGQLSDRDSLRVKARLLPLEEKKR